MVFAIELSLMLFFSLIFFIALILIPLMFWSETRIHNPKVSEDEVLAALEKMRDLRLFGVTRDVDPWAMRQALIIALELDTKAALERGVARENLDAFDREARQDAQNFLRLSAKEKSGVIIKHGS